MESNVIGSPHAAHRYEVGVVATGELAKREGIEPKSILVDAHNRDHAARLAERCGYMVIDVNMIG